MRMSRPLALLVGMSLLFGVNAHATELTLSLKGVEVAKGVDVGPVRYGTSFVGEAYDEARGATVGYWNIALNYRGAAHVGECGGENDVVLFLITVYFTSGDLAGNKVVLGMTSKKGFPVYWSYRGTPCDQIGGLCCDCPSGDQVLCSDGQASNLAEITGMSLSPQFGTTLRKVKGATLDGWLCHTYPVVPRVTGTLSIVLNQSPN